MHDVAATQMHRSFILYCFYLILFACLSFLIFYSGLLTQVSKPLASQIRNQNQFFRSRTQSSISLIVTPSTGHDPKPVPSTPTYDLFNDAVSSSGYIMSNGKIISE
jgi:hypothetical protein